MRESNPMTGKVRILLTDRSGKLLLDTQAGNMIVESGRRLMADLFAGKPGGKSVEYMGIGTGNPETTAEMTALTQEAVPLEADQDPRTLVTSEVRDQENGSVITVTAAFRGEKFIAGDGDTLSLREAGLFTDSAGGIMYNRVTFDEIPLRKGYEITLIWDVTFPSAPL